MFVGALGVKDGLFGGKREKGVSGVLSFSAFVFCIFFCSVFVPRGLGIPGQKVCKRKRGQRYAVQKIIKCVCVCACFIFWCLRKVSCSRFVSLLSYTHIVLTGGAGCATEEDIYWFLLLDVRRTQAFFFFFCVVRIGKDCSRSIGDRCGCFSCRVMPWYAWHERDIAEDKFDMVNNRGEKYHILQDVILGREPNCHAVIALFSHRG